MAINETEPAVLPDCTLVDPETSRSAWVLDLWLVPNNAFRHELTQMYKALDGMAARGASLSDDDLELFFKWYQGFKEYLQEMKDVEDQVLRPWVAKKVSRELREGQHKAVFDKYNDDHVYLMLQTNQISNLRMKIGKKPPKDILADDLTKVLGVMGHAVVRQARFREELLVPIVKAHVKLADRDPITRAFWREVTKDTKHSKESVLISVAWMDSKLKQKWKRKIFASSLRPATLLKSITHTATPHRKLLAPLFPGKHAHDDPDSDDDHHFLDAHPDDDAHDAAADGDDAAVASVEPLGLKSGDTSVSGREASPKPKAERKKPAASFSAAEGGKDEEGRAKDRERKMEEAKKETSGRALAHGSEGGGKGEGMVLGTEKGDGKKKKKGLLGMMKLESGRVHHHEESSF